MLQRWRERQDHVDDGLLDPDGQDIAVDLSRAAGTTDRASEAGGTVDPGTTLTKDLVAHMYPGSSEENVGADRETDAETDGETGVETDEETDDHNLGPGAARAPGNMAEEDTPQAPDLGKAASPKLAAHSAVAERDAMALPPS